MNFKPWKPIACSILLLTGCSGPQEDVRISFCKNLTAELLTPGTRLEWHASEQQAKGPEPATITVHLETSDQAGHPQTMQATCRYPYDAADANAVTQSNPLSAYATVPYQMSLNGLPVPDIRLREAILVVQLATGEAAVDQVKRGIEVGVEKLHSAIANDSKQ